MRSQTQILGWMKESLNSFLLEEGLDRSAHTMEAYKYDIGKFLEYLHGKGVKKISSLKRQHVIDYLGYCKQGGKSNATVHRYFMAIRCYCKYLRKTKALEGDIVADIKAKRGTLPAPYIPSRAEIDCLLAQPCQGSESGTRDKAILSLIYSSGLRASELCDLELQDFRGYEVIVKCGKRSKTRTVPVSEEVSINIRTYIDLYRGKEPGYLFLTILGRQLRRQLLCKMVVEYARKAGIRGVTTHTLRHACATHLLEQGANLRFIQKMLGHSTIASTERYTHLSGKEMQEMFEQYHPRRIKGGSPC
jgi:integrase/recombinase XerD